jgi:MoaA/NifB/PqqE/SkfB family radical SAM enzyme
MSVTAAAYDAEPRLRFLWLEVTGRCNLRCVHCYNASGPEGDHGTMTSTDWRNVIEEAATLGVENVQFIGGEPTLHPDLASLVRHALNCGLGVEVYSNLARPLPPELWEVLVLPGVRLATSYYAIDTLTHELVTAGPAGSHRRTRANIVEALGRDIPLRVGVVQVTEDQDVEAAVADLRELGVAEVNVDRLRQVGRGVRDQEPGVEQLCGRCADGVLTVTPSGDVLPCVFARWLVLGNARETGLGEIHDAAEPTRAQLRSSFRPRAAKCGPNDSDPGGCNPDHKDCSPWE